MSGITIPRRHYSQPQGRLEVAPEWAQAGFVFADVPALLQAVDAGGVGVLVPKPTPTGLALRIPPDHSAHRIVRAPDSVFDCRGEFTCIAVATRRGTHTSYPMFFCRQNPTQIVTTGRAGFAHHNGTGNVYFGYRNAADSGWVETPGYSSPIGERVVWLATRVVTGGTGTLYLYRNGVLVRTQAAAEGGTPPSNSRVRYGTHGNPPAENDLEFAAWSTRSVSAQQARVISDNPYQLLRADPLFIHDVAGAAPPAFPTLSSLATSHITATGARHSLTLSWGG